MIGAIDEAKEKAKAVEAASPAEPSSEHKVQIKVQPRGESKPVVKQGVNAH